MQQRRHKQFGYLFTVLVIIENLTVIKYETGRIETRNKQELFTNSIEVKNEA
jgi:hypothetical protein